jgi:TPR repeat protein
VEWYIKGAEAGLPRAMFSLALCLDKGEGVAAPDPAAAAGWYRRAANAEVDTGNPANGLAAITLSYSYLTGRGRARQIMPATSSATLKTLVS